MLIGHLKKGYNEIALKNRIVRLFYMTGVQIRCLRNIKSTHTLIVIYDNMVVYYIMTKFIVKAPINYRENAKKC